jgi:hypothetical protein
MNKSEILKALEWVDQTARDGDVFRLEKAKQALEEELNSRRGHATAEIAFKTAVESFVRKHGREPLEDIPLED